MILATAVSHRDRDAERKLSTPVRIDMNTSRQFTDTAETGLSTVSSWHLQHRRKIDFKNGFGLSEQQEKYNCKNAFRNGTLIRSTSVEVEVTLRLTVSQSVSQSVSMSLYRAPLWDLQPDITSCRNVAV
jgi:uncharacterized protein (DUF2252 family)